MLVDLKEFFDQYAVSHPEKTLYECKVLRLGRVLIDEQIGYGVVHVSRIEGKVATFGMLD